MSFCLSAAALWALFSPSEVYLGPLARILDIFAPWILGLGLGLALGVFALGARRLGAGLSVLAIAGGLVLGGAYRQITMAQVDAPGALRVLFFNARARNTRFADQIVSAALAENPDIVVFAEATALRPALDRLRAEYAFVSPCTEQACEILLATNLEVHRFWQLALNPAWPPRYGVLEFERPEGGTAFLATSHLLKPWFSGLAETEIAQLTGQLNWFEDGPVAVVGDFNMAPWSEPMRALLHETGFRALRGQPGSWPARDRAFRVPIDQLLLRDMTASHIEPFGAELNSNHRGFIAELAF